MTADYEAHAKNIDAAVEIVLDLLKWGSGAFPQVALASPFIRMFVQYEAHKLKDGLAAGTIVPDGAGGFVPISNSRYDPKTGEFL